MKLIEKLTKHSVTVGIHKKDNNTYPDSDVTTAEVGFWQEYGTVKMPPRLWLRIFNLINREKEQLSEVISDAIKNNDDVDDILNDIGAYEADRIRDRIQSNEVAPKSKKDGTTLIDTGQLVNSINYEVH